MKINTIMIIVSVCESNGIVIGNEVNAADNCNENPKRT